MIDTARYLHLNFASGGRTRPDVDCWGLYRLIVGENRGIWLAEFAGTEELRDAARVAREQASDGLGWVKVAPGAERVFDAVLMRGLLRDGGSVRRAPVHVGCVVAEGRMLDIEEIGGVRERAFRATVRQAAPADVVNRVVGIFRPEALA